MKITIDLPKYTSCAFVNYVYATETGMSMGVMNMGVKSLDSDDLVDGNEVKVLGAEGGDSE